MNKLDDMSVDMHLKGLLCKKNSFLVGHNFHICLLSGPRGLTPPPLTVSLTVKYPFFYELP